MSNYWDPERRRVDLAFLEFGLFFLMAIGSLIGGLSLMRIAESLEERKSPTTHEAEASDGAR